MTRNSPLRRAIQVAVLAFFATPVVAQTAAQDTGLYLGYSLGASRYSLDTAAFADSEVGRELGGRAAMAGDTHATSGARKIFVGYDLNRYLGTEAAMVNLGTYRAKYFSSTTGSQIGSQDYSASAITLAGTARYEFDSGVVLKAKAGVALTDTVSDYQVARPAGTLASNDPTASKTNLYWSLAAGYRFNPHWTLFLDYENFGAVGSRNNTGQADVKSLTASLQYRF